VRKLKFIFLAVTVIGFFSLVSCSKSNNSGSNSNADTVYYSNWVTLSTTFNSGDSAYEENISAPKITQTVLDQDVLLSYVQFQGLVIGAGDFGVFPAYMVGNINVLSGLGDLTGAGLQFRYVIIPGKVAITAFPGMTQKQINKLTITDVTNSLNSAAKKSPSIN
jgi:hypothetical protein